MVIEIDTCEICNVRCSGADMEVGISLLKSLLVYINEHYEDLRISDGSVRIELSCPWTSLESDDEEKRQSSYSS